MITDFSQHFVCTIVLLWQEISKKKISLWSQTFTPAPPLLDSMLSPRASLICLAIASCFTCLSHPFTLFPSSLSRSPSICLQQLALVCLSFYVTGDVIKQDEAIGWLWHFLSPRGDRKETKRQRDRQGKMRKVYERGAVRGSRTRLTSHVYMDTIDWNKRRLMGLKRSELTLIRRQQREGGTWSGMFLQDRWMIFNISLIFMISRQPIGLLARRRWHNNILACPAHVAVNLFGLIAWCIYGIIWSNEFASM